MISALKISLAATWKRFLTVNVSWHKMSGSNNGGSSGQMWNIFHRWNFQNLDYDRKEKENFIIFTEADR